jgi:putative tricarboxylic transport membrane protein
MLKGLIGGAIGLLLSTVGMDSVTATFRYTFGSDILLAGIDIVAGLIGLFALSQVLVYFEEAFTHPDARIVEVRSQRGMLLRTVLDTFRRKRALTIGSVIGTIIGIIPGAGGQVSALTAYNEAKRWAPQKERESFGKGNPDGIVACESANNAMAGGSLIPLFTLGIPGSPTAAVLLGGLMIHGLFPGYQLYSVSADVTYTFMVAMILAQFVMFGIGIGISGHVARILRVPKYFLGPAITSLCIIGAFATRNSLGDVYVMAALGILMYFGIKYGFSAAAVVLGLILGEIAENGFLLGVRIGSAKKSVLSYFIARPIPAIIVLLVLLSIGFALFLEHKERAAKRKGLVEDRSLPGRLSFGRWWPISEITMRQWNLLIGLGLLIGGILIYFQTRGFPREPRLFPMVLVVALLVMAAWLILQSVFMPTIGADRRPFHKWPALNMWTVIGITVLYIATLSVAGFYASTFLFMLLMPIYLNKNRTGPFFIKCLCVSLAFTGIMLLVFNQFLKVSTPSGWLI